MMKGIRRSRHLARLGGGAKPASGYGFNYGRFYGGFFRGIF